MPASVTNNPLYTNALYGSYGTGTGTQGAQAQALGQSQQTVASPVMQAFGGSSGFERGLAQGFIQGFSQGAQGALQQQGGVPAFAQQGALGGVAGGGFSPQVMQALQGLVTALTQVVQQLGSLMQSMGGQAPAGAGAGAGGGLGGGIGGAPAGGLGGGIGGPMGALGGNAGNAGGAGGAGGAYGGNGGAAGNAGGAGGVGGGVGPVGAGGQNAAGTINPNTNYQTLNNQQRNQMSGMNEDQRAALHLWGIQMGSAGRQDGGVYMNVLQNPSQFKPAEVALVQRLAAQEQAQFGGFTGKLLDQAFFGVYQQLTGKDVSQRYANSPINFAQGPVNMANRQTGQNGLSNFENSVMQLWGHNPLLSGGKIDGSILAYSLNSPFAMEANLNRNDLLALQQMDMASDGVMNGDSLEKNFIEVMDKMYMGDAGASVQGGMNAALQEAAERRQGLLPPPAPETQGISPQSLQAMNNAIQQGKGASACPFLSGGGGVQGAQAAGW